MSATTRLRLATIAVVAVAAALPSTAHATWAGRSGRIVWLDSAIRTIRPDGTHARSLGVSGGALSVSRGGKWIAYAAHGSFWRIGVDGSHRKRIGKLRAPYDRPASTAWAPGGHRLSFETLTEVGDEDTGTFHTIHELWVVGSDGKHLHKVTRGSEAVWSRNGRHLLYAEEDGDIAQIRPTGTGHRTLYHQGGNSLHLDLSPDGRRLVYEWLPYNGPFRIRTLDLKRRRLVGSFTTRYGSKVNAGDLAWAPGGRRIAFIHSVHGVNKDELRTVRPDGTHVRRLFRFPPPAHGRASPLELAWQTR